MKSKGQEGLNYFNWCKYNLTSLNFSMLKCCVFAPSMNLIISCKNYVDEECLFVLGTLWSIWETNIYFFFASSTIFLTTENICKAFVFIKQLWFNYIKNDRALKTPNKIYNNWQKKSYSFATFRNYNYLQKWRPKICYKPLN